MIDDFFLNRLESHCASAISSCDVDARLRNMGNIMRELSSPRTVFELVQLARKGLLVEQNEDDLK